MNIFVVGDIHAQRNKFWHILQEAGLVDTQNQATERLLDSDTKLILLGDIVHAKSRERYAKIIDEKRFDEFSPSHLVRAERFQEKFLAEIKTFYDSLEPGKLTILMGNHDFNAIYPEQGPLRTDDIAHLEWKDITNRRINSEIRDWMLAWPYELVIDDIHFAHVGPLKEHNTYDNDFYLKNRRRWIYEDKDFIADTLYRLGVYGHTPVRGGVNIASQGKAILLDTNGNASEYAYLKIVTEEGRYHLKMRGLFFDEFIQR